jgi:hypothetical protein
MAHDHLGRAQNDTGASRFQYSMLALGLVAVMAITVLMLANA